MRTMNPDDVINVEEWTRAFIQRKSTKDRFRFPMTDRQAANILYAAYRAEVINRQREFLDDEATREHIRLLANYLTQDSPKFGVLLCGNCGNGKTTMLYAFQNALNFLNDRGYFEKPREIGIRIVDARESFELAKNYERFKEIRSHRMIGLEDIGREATEVIDYGNAISPIIEIIEYRYVHQLFTFITTNLTPKQLREKYGTRIADRFNEMLEVIIFTNDTYRK